MRIAIGGDHRGLELKQFIIKLITRTGHKCEDFGTYTTDSIDYPDIAQKVAEAVTGDGFECGILVCDTGIGMSIAANKVNGIRATLCHDTFLTVRARRHNDANILCLGAREGQEKVPEILEAFLATDFEGGRHQNRLNKIKILEG